MKKSTAIDINNKISPKEFHEILYRQVKTVVDDPTMASKLPPLYVHSSPGSGKSSIVKSVAEELGIGFIDVRLAQMEPCDIRGLPVPNHEKHTMEWFVNGTWPNDPNSKGIIFLDELSSCDRSIAVAAYELVLDRRLGSLYKVPDGWYICAAGNLTTDKAVAAPIPSALANRFIHFELETNAEDWLMWATTHSINPIVTGYINYCPQALMSMEDENLSRGFPTPRSWERVSSMLDLYKDADERILRKIVYGLIGNRRGIEFMSFYKVNHNFDSVLDMMLGKKAISIPEENDRKYAMCSALTYLVWKGKSEEDTNKRISGFMDITMNMSSDFATMAMMSAMNGNNKNENKQVFVSKLYHHPKFKEWANKHGKSLAKRSKLVIK